MKQSRIRYKQTMSLMLMQNSCGKNLQIQNGKQNNILHADGYNLMYPKSILLSMKWVKQRKESGKTMEKCKIEVKRNYFLELQGCFYK